MSYLTPEQEEAAKRPKTKQELSDSLNKRLGKAKTTAEKVAFFRRIVEDFWHVSDMLEKTIKVRDQGFEVGSPYYRNGWEKRFKDIPQWTMERLVYIDTITHAEPRVSKIARKYHTNPDETRFPDIGRDFVKTLKAIRDDSLRGSKESEQFVGWLYDLQLRVEQGDEKRAERKAAFLDWLKEGSNKVFWTAPVIGTILAGLAYLSLRPFGYEIRKIDDRPAASSQPSRTP